VILRLVNKKTFSSPEWNRDTYQVADKDIGIWQKEGEGVDEEKDIEVSFSTASFEAFKGGCTLCLVLLD
jgi:hypothetical protein